MHYFKAAKRQKKNTILKGWIQVQVFLLTWGSSYTQELQRALAKATLRNKKRAPGSLRAGTGLTAEGDTGSALVPPTPCLGFPISKMQILPTSKWYHRSIL